MRDGLHDLDHRCTNTSTDDKGIQSASISWGDGTVVSNVFSAADGSYTTVAMRPGTYALTATKSGYSFASPTAVVTTPPAATTTNLVATGP